DFRPVQAGALRGLSPWRALVNSWALLKGAVQAWRILRSFRPDAILATGGYASAPVVMAAWLGGCPVLIYLPDILPGLAVRFLSRLAKRVAVSFDASLAHFPPGKAVVTGYPVRPALYQGNRAEARRRLGLALDEKVILVLGGSRGAHSINQAVAEILEHLLSMAQLIHVAGEQDAAWLQERQNALPGDLSQRYHVYAYLHEEMTEALLAAELAVARAGAATMGEFAAVGLPAILVPYPYAGQHQEANADFMVSRGAALKMADHKLAEGALAPLVEELLADEQRLRVIADNARKLAKPDAARAIAQQLALLAGGV
ncbi:MAG: UDP-N-acetylglucosamine--N-acetylmuramyl-(pentapeptide) pyrophosphoryl-undecaprenol N-acetylglucosamine transferase, partial [Chloroflexi bacterium]|nr:UDP-N-acetylglucosamine--N-acetylmuramyl-(pentapeptide) pyrophosphoryl-undecaprenol N-acetylglucosamine transferase [Chloroflexota bacterium]